MVLKIHKIMQDALIMSNKGEKKKEETEKRIMCKKQVHNKHLFLH